MSEEPGRERSGERKGGSKTHFDKEEGVNRVRMECWSDHELEQKGARRKKTISKMGVKVYTTLPQKNGISLVRITTGSQASKGR